MSGGAVDIFTHTYKARTAVAKFAAVEHANEEDFAVNVHTNPTRGVALGICQRDVSSGQAAPITSLGITRFLAGTAAIIRGQALIAAGSGFLSGVASGTVVASATTVMGRAIQSVASGMVGLMNLNTYVIPASGGAIF